MSKKTAGARASEVPVSGTAVDASPTFTTTESDAVNYVAVASDNPQNNFVTTGLVQHMQNADMSSLPGGAPSVTTYSPNGTTTIPNGTIGVDPNGLYVGDYWPATPNTYPNPFNPSPFNPSIPAVGSTITWQTNQYWGVQKKDNQEKGGPEYWVVNPLTLPYIDSLGSASIIARCLTDNDANYICRILNEDFERVNASVSAKSCKCDGVKECCSHCIGVVDTQRPSAITYPHFKDSLKSLEGRVLTVIDAAIESESRNKALKTLFKREFRKTITQLYDFCHRHLSAEHEYSYGCESDNEE